MTVAIAIVGSLAILFTLPMPLISWLEAAEEDSNKGIFYGMAVGVTLGFLLTVTLFVLALATQSIVAISIVGGLALLCGLSGIFVCLINADKNNAVGGAMIVTLGWFLTVALFVLALVK